jgi:hypothetical protein
VTVNRVAILMPPRDPRGVLVGEVARVDADVRARQAWAILREAATEVVAVASPTGSPATRDAFASLGASIRPREEGGAGTFMWALVDAALAVNADHYFVPDSDRLLHWLLSYPDELTELTRRWGQHDVLALARSPRAVASHPPTQTLTEGPVSELIADAIRLPGADPFSGAYMLSRRALEAIVASDAPRDQTFYAEAFLAPARAGCSFDLWVVEGLEWETPDNYRAEIAARGYEAWLADFQSPRQWEQRVRMMVLWIERVRAYSAAQDR